MQVSILIVTKNRMEELEQTLIVLENIIDKTIHEVLVFDDGSSDNTLELLNKFDWVKWENSKISLGASVARNMLYRKALGDIFIGLDDDAHPLTENFISKVEFIFNRNPNIGIIAFQEVKGVYSSNEEALKSANLNQEEYFCNEFIGCGFAIRKEVYSETNGFPVWMDIYGEESCLALEVVNLGYDILYSDGIMVNHRIDREKRFEQGRNYFRFERQLRNMINYYIVYYPNPVLKIVKLLNHNFFKYAIKDKQYLVLFFKASFTALKKYKNTLGYRKPVSKKTIRKIQKLKNIKY
ncbi:glycosyltransferase family 2 protein [Flavobacterium ranwuense]|uniref:Glycosyltransferase family 2 protein n=1 Tax=Flavobacterium ranwuense TaxID=2541725 RepID=A0ABY2DQ19_9FLAO|nr:glycosyltransferase [Flavobacterium ranwuense]TDE28042.1 glycosyltransferase family 2 protein [Flavobacterium ranwuense]